MGNFKQIIEEEKTQRMNELEAFRDLAKVMVSKILGKTSGSTDEVVRNSYLQAYKRVGKFNQKQELGSWFFRIVVNEFLKIKRGIIKKGAKNSYFIDSKRTPRIYYASKEEVLLIQNIIQSLPSRYRNAFSFDETKKHAVKKFKD